MAGGYVTPDRDPLDQLRSELVDAKQRLAELERPTGTQLASTVAALQETVAALEAQQDYLESLTVTAAAGSTTLVTVAVNTWSTGPSLSISTSTGKLKVTVTGLLSGGSGGGGIATFSIAGHVNRDTQISALTSGTLNGNANCYHANSLEVVTGSFSQIVTGLPVNTSLTVAWEFRQHGGSAVGGYTGPQIFAEVVA